MSADMLSEWSRRQWINFAATRRMVFNPAGNRWMILSAVSRRPENLNPTQKKKRTRDFEMRVTVAFVTARFAKPRPSLSRRNQAINPQALVQGHASISNLLHEKPLGHRSSFFSVWNPWIL
jgi:hypothetical protein